MRIAAACCVLAGLGAAPSPAEDFRPPTPQEIARAIRTGTQWLKKAQRSDGSWGPCFPGGVYGAPHRAVADGYPLGPTAFALFCLSECGVRRTDRVVAKGLRWLDGNAPQIPGGEKFRRCTSYEAAALVLMLTSLNDASPQGKPAWAPRSGNPRSPPAKSKFKRAEWVWMHWLVQHLLECQSHYGGWKYYASKRGYHDVSTTQFALLALREAVRAGYPIDDDVWMRAARGLREFAVKRGAFRYHSSEPWTAGRTAAGVSSLLICRERLERGPALAPEWIDDLIDNGLAHMDTTFDVRRNTVEPGAKPAHYHYCHLYGIERVGSLSGRREFGGKSWYSRGAAYLLAEQAADGRWTDATCMRPTDTLGTGFALLFLKRATPPVTR